MAHQGLPPSPVKSDHSRTSITLKLPNAQGEALDKSTVPLTEPARQSTEVYTQKPTPIKPVDRKIASPLLTDNEVNRIVVARVIERTWLSYRDKQMFRLLKHALIAAEHSLSYEILRKLSPQEAHFLKDPSLMTRVRFRFGGSEFPPMIFFKIFTNSSGKGMKYISGKKMIRPASEAAQDACDLMGNRKFFDQMIQDALMHQQFRVTDEMDVTTLKDYMQYLSHLDETPANLGGRDNLWRKLTLDVLPRTTILYDVIDYMYQSRRLTPNLKLELPYLLSRPVTQDMQLKHIRIISRTRDPTTPPQVGKTRTTAPTSTQASGRRSKQARMRAIKMRQTYGAPGNTPRESTAIKDEDDFYEGAIDRINKADEWDEEANQLFEWSQDLNIDETLGTPRLYETPQIDSVV